MHDVKNPPVIPVSAGVPPIVVYAGLVGVCVILTVLGATVAGSPYHHIWPSINTTHIRL